MTSTTVDATSAPDASVSEIRARSGQAVAAEVEEAGETVAAAPGDTKSDSSKAATAAGVSAGLLAATALMVLLRSIDFVLYIRMAKKIGNYSFLLGNFFLPLAFLVVTWPIIIVRLALKRIPKSTLKFKVWKFILMGVFDSLAVLLATVPAAYVSGTLNTVMAQSVIIVNAVCSFLFLRARYTFMHVLGIVLVCAGILTALYPSFFVDERFTPHGSSGDASVDWKLPLCLVTLFAANIPMALSNVYKEKFLKQADLDVLYANGWISLFQFLFGLLMAPMILLPLPGQEHVTIDGLPAYVRDGFKCFAGFDSREGDKCDYMWAVFCVFICFNVSYNVLMLTVIKKGSALLAMVSSTARLALSNFGFLVQPLAVEAYSNKVTVYDFIALYSLVSGIFVFAREKEQVASDDDLIVQGQQEATSLLGELFCCACRRRASRRKLQLLQRSPGSATTAAGLDKEDVPVAQLSESAATLNATDVEGQRQMQDTEATPLLG